jgi:hypothetical protein
VTVTFDVTAAPTFSLTPPTQQQWNDAQKEPVDRPLPTTNAFQLVFSNLAASATIDNVPPMSANGALTAFGIVAIDNGIASLTVAGVLLDETNFSDWDKIIVNGILIPNALKMVDKLLSNFPVPQVPTLAGLKFQPLALAIMPAGIVIGSTLDGGGTTDLSGFALPPPQLFAVTKLSLLNQVLAATIKGKYVDEGEKGPSGWTASGKVSVDNPKVTARIDNGLVLDISGKFSAYGELSGTGVGITKALLCPIGAAADAIANPSNWDKVISSFDLVYQPDPMPIPVTTSAAAVSGTPATQSIEITVPSDQFPSSIKLFVKPTWSGSVTGAALSAAAAAFVDLVMAIFGSLIIKKIIGSYGHESFTLPVASMSKTINLPQGAPITVALSATVGASLQPFGTDQLTQSLDVAVS